ncbi:MAG: hypothetical protein NVSMB4_08260 [Acidimicrobiales bacterium]
MSRGAPRLKSLEPVISVERTSQSGLLLGLALAGMSVIGLAAASVSSATTRWGARQGPLLVLAGVGSLFVLCALRWPALLSGPAMFPVLVGGVAALTAEAWWWGPIIGPYGTMSSIWPGMAAHLYFRRWTAFGLTAYIGAAYAVLLGFQKGNPAPVTQWILVIGVVLVSGSLAGALADHIRLLVRKERELSSQIDHDRERLEVATQRRNDFLAGMSHELRTPLNAIIGFAGVLGEELFGPVSAGQMSRIAEIRVAGTRLLDLVGEVLAPETSSRNVPAPEAASLVDRVPILRADPRGAAAFFLLAPIAVVTLPNPRLVGVQAGRVLVVAAVGAALDALVLLSPRFPATLRAASHVAVTTAVAMGIAYAAGPQIAPFATMTVLWMATAAAIRLSALGAAVQVVLIAVLEAVLLHFQRGNGGAFVRWEMTVGTATVSAIAIRGIVDRLFAAAEREAAARHAASGARADIEIADRHAVAFLRSVRHELRPTLETVAIAAADLAGGTLGPLTARQAEYATDIVEATNHLRSLVHDILDLADADAGKLRSDAVLVDAGDMLAQCMKRFEELAADRGIDLDGSVVPLGARLRADPDKLGRALAGLISNAVKFTPAGGGVRVEIRVATDAAYLSVTDTGPGIPESDRRRIFEQFQQGAPSASAPGAGVGLTLAERFVEIQGGWLELRTVPGSGSTFTIVLPVGAHRPQGFARSWPPADTAGRGADRTDEGAPVR